MTGRRHRYWSEVRGVMRRLLVPLVFIAVIVLVVFGVAGETWLAWITIAAVLAGGAFRSRTAPKVRMQRAEPLDRVYSLESELKESQKRIVSLENILATRYRDTALDNLRQSILGEVAAALVEYDHGGGAVEALESLRRSLTRLSSR